MSRSIIEKCCGAALFFLLLTGCGDTEPIIPEEKAPDSALGQEQTAVYDLLEEKWADGPTDKEAFSWNVSDCLEVSLPDAESADSFYYFSAVEGSCYYVLQDLLIESDEGFTHALYWTVTDVTGGESVMEQWELRAADDAGEEAGELLKAFKDNRAWITGMDVSEGEVYLFIQQSEARETTHYYRVRTSRKGHMEELLDLLPALREGKVLSAENILLPGGRCDSEGRSYVGDSAVSSRICVIGRDGELLTVMEMPGEAGAPLACIGKLPEGGPLYAGASAGEQRLIILAYDGQDQKELYRGEYEIFGQCLLRPNGDLVYSGNGGLLRWNVLQGSRESLYDGKNLNFANCDGILEGAGGKLFAVLSREDGTFLYGFTDQETESVVIRLEMLCRGDDYIRACAAEYEMRNPGVVIELAEPEEDAGAQLNRLMARMSLGEGPELLLVKSPQLQTLQREGMLAELSGVLPEDEQQQIFPGALENGRIDGGLYGISYTATLSTLLVSDQVWQDGRWTLEDILQLIKEREGTEDEIEQFSDYLGTSGRGSQMLYNLVLANIGDSSFLDLQAGKCYFDTEEFCQVLELCKKWEQKEQGGQRTEQEQVLEGKALVYKVEGNLIHFSRALASLGEGFHAVGYPARERTGNLMMGYGGCVAVSANAEHREVIDDFLRFLVGYKAQKLYGINWVRIDLLRDSVEERIENYDGTVTPVFRIGNRSVIPLEGKTDGSSYLSEFLEAAGSAVSYEAELDLIRNMVEEEAAACFAGDKGVQETSRIIQSRVQIYLDELK